MLLKNKSKIEAWLNKYAIRNYTLIKDIRYGYVVNVNENVEINNQSMKKIKVKFNIINGWFDCDNNLLTSLEGSPEIVKSDFYCNSNKLKSLKGCPKIIEGDFHCSSNKLTISELIKELPKEIKTNNIFIFNNNLNNLEFIEDFNELKEKLKIFLEKKKLLDLINRENINKKNNVNKI